MTEKSVYSQKCTDQAGFWTSGVIGALLIVNANEGQIIVNGEKINQKK